MRRYPPALGGALGGLGAALLAGACRDATAPAGAAARAALPLAVGTRWAYAQEDSVELGARPYVPGTLIVTAARDTVVAGRRGTVLDGGRVLLTGRLGPVIVSADGAGVSAAEPEIAAARIGPWSLVLAYPARAGDGPPGSWRVTAVDTTVTVPAGTFRCVRYDLPPAADGAPLGTILLAPGTGVVFSTYGRWEELELPSRRVVGRHRTVFRLARLTPPGA